MELRKCFFAIARIASRPEEMGTKDRASCFNAQYDRLGLSVSKNTSQTGAGAIKRLHSGPNTALASSAQPFSHFLRTTLLREEFFSKLATRDHANRDVKMKHFSPCFLFKVLWLLREEELMSLS
jgi:hypothetical protein